ncbi:MAG: thiamine phosphate synthase [Planctomycetota bacterium]
MQTTYRIIDAASNRVGEGLRTIEECCRFALNDTPLTDKLKQLRHEFQSALSRLEREKLLRARDSEGDVGSKLEGSNEYRRDGYLAIVAAASERVRQSLRVIEEYGKTLDVEFAHLVESIRYRSYQVLRDVELVVSASQRRERLAGAVLYALIDCKSSDQEWQRCLRDLSHAGVDVFQLRDKRASDRELFERAVTGATVASECGVLFIVNDRPDIALASGADGVHLGQEEIPIAAARELLGQEHLIGISTHSVSQVHEAIDAGADYIGCGPTFPSRTKSFASHTGIEFLKQVHEATREKPRPAFAVGGVDESNIQQVLTSGFHRVAVTAAIQQAADPPEAARRIKRALAEH